MVGGKPRNQLRTDEVIKMQASAIFQELGITMSDAINIFLRQSIMHGGLPFELKIPRYNEITIAALTDMEQSKGRDIHGVDVNTALAALKDIVLSPYVIQMSEP